MYDLLNPHVDKLVVCNPRKNALLKDGNKSDRIDARKLAELLRGNQLKPVYHGENGVRMLRELSRSYLAIVKDLSRVMNRLKAVYRSWAIPCAGRDVYYRRHRAQWLDKIREVGVRRRAERLYEQLDMLQHLRQQARRELLAEARKHAITAAPRFLSPRTLRRPASCPAKLEAYKIQQCSDYPANEGVAFTVHLYDENLKSISAPVAAVCKTRPPSCRNRRQTGQSGIRRHRLTCQRRLIVGQVRESPFCLQRQRG